MGDPFPISPRCTRQGRPRPVEVAVPLGFFRQGFRSLGAAGMLGRGRAAPARSRLGGSNGPESRESGTGFGTRGIDRRGLVRRFVWNDLRSLETARRELVLGRHASARERLAALSAKRPGRGEVELPLGDAEQASGRHKEATAAWSRVPAPSPEFPEAALRLAQAWIEGGRLSEAEAALREALKRPSPRALDLRQLLIQLLWGEGRLEETRPLIEENYLGLAESQGPASPMALLTLHGLLALDFETYPLDQAAKRLADLAAKNPADDRVALGRALLAIRAGRLDEAGALLEACREHKPDDPASWRAALDLAMALGSLEGVEAAARHLTAGDLSPVEIHAVAAWIARKRDDPAAERRAWESLLAKDKGSAIALERLAELDLAAGRSAEALEFRKRKASVDEARQGYRALLQSDYKATAPSSRGSPSGSAAPSKPSPSGRSPEIASRASWPTSPGASRSPSPVVPSGRFSPLARSRPLPRRRAGWSTTGGRPRGSRSGRRPRASHSPIRTDDRPSAGFPRPCPGALRSSTSTATAGSTSISSRGVRPSPPTHRRPTTATASSATSATARSRTSPPRPVFPATARSTASA